MPIIIALFLTVLIGAVVQTYYDKNWYKHLEAEAKFLDDHVKEGETSRIQEVICNNKRLMLPSILVKFPVDCSIRYKQPENTKKTDKQYRSDCIIAMPYEKVTRTFEVEFTKRGFFMIPTMELVASDFFFIDIYAKRISNQSSIYVYPSRTKVKQVGASFERMMGEYVTKTFINEDPFEFRGIRAYEPTDPMKKINWGVSARTGELMVNQFYDTNQCTVTLFLELESEGMMVYEELQEECIRIVRTYLELFMKKGIGVNIITNAIDISTGEKIEFPKNMRNTNMEVYLKQLARIDTKKKMQGLYNSIANMKKQEAGINILVSVSQSKKLQEAYEAYLGKESYGEWMILTNSSIEHKAISNRVHITYGEVE